MRFLMVLTAVSTKPLKSVQSWTPQAKTAFFGTGEFIPLICLPMRYLPPGLFSALAYPMFNYLFRWSDRNWKVRPDKVSEQSACAQAAHVAVCVPWAFLRHLQRERRPKYFQFTPRPQSVKLVTHWSDMTKSGKLHRARLSTGELGPDYPLEKIACPLALFHGQSDYLADCAGLVRHLQSQYVGPNGTFSTQACRTHINDAPSIMLLALLRRSQQLCGAAACGGD